MSVDINRKAMKLSDFRRHHYVEGSAPCMRTLKQWIDDPEVTELEGYSIGSQYFVYMEPAVDVSLEKALAEIGAAA